MTQIQDKMDIEQIAAMSNATKTNVLKYLCRAEFSHIQKTIIKRKVYYEKVSIQDIEQLYRLTHRKTQYSKLIEQNKELQQELRIKNNVILNIVNYHEPELLTMDEIMERYGKNGV